MQDNFSVEEILKYAIENDMLDYDAIKNKMEMNERKKYLDKHVYKISQGNDGKWRTYLPDSDKGRKQVKRTTRKDIEDVVINYWKNNSQENKRRQEIEGITLKSLFPRWLDYKQAHTNSTTYIRRILDDWNKYYAPQEDFINKPIIKFTKLELDIWAHNMIKEYNMTQKIYYNMTIIIRQSLNYACDELGNISENLFNKVKVNTKLFRRTKKKSGNTQVFSIEEQDLFTQEMVRRFNKDTTNPTPLAIMLSFELGVRLGELCALKFSDIEGDKIHIQHQVVAEYERVNDFEMSLKGYKIVEYTKSDDGDRYIYLTTTAMRIIELARRLNIANNESNEEGFIFVKNGTFLSKATVDSTIRNACKKIGIPVKYSHKIRKTYISTLIDSGLNIDEIRRMVGHADERTTYGNYCFNRLTDSQTANLIENALNGQKVIRGNQLFDSI